MPHNFWLLPTLLFAFGGLFQLSLALPFLERTNYVSRRIAEEYIFGGLFYLAIALGFALATTIMMVLAVTFLVGAASYAVVRCVLFLSTPPIMGMTNR